MLQAADSDAAVPDGETGTATSQVDGSGAVIDVCAAQRAVRDLLDAFGFDSSEDGLAETPRRVTAILMELLGALRDDIATRREFFDERTTESERLRRSPFLVSRRETFNAAHQLRDSRLSDDENRRLFGKCVSMHGHNYLLEVTVCGDPDPSTGYVIDLKVLSDLINAEIVEHVDHKNLNADVPWLAGRIPTAENLAEAFWDRLAPHLPAGVLHAVRVCETDKNWVEYTGRN